MKFLALVAAAYAIHLRKEDQPAHARSYNADSEVVKSDFAVNNDDVLAHPFNMVQTFPEYDGWKQAAKPDAAKNACVNINKASGKEEPCSTIGNSAWNTLTSAKTAKPADAQASPYPLHGDHIAAEKVRTAK